jgi:hypothetical protein
MEKFTYQEVMRAIKVGVGVVLYVALNCDEMSIVDN